MVWKPSSSGKRSRQ
jgi:hypothetical protein